MNSRSNEKRVARWRSPCWPVALQLLEPVLHHVDLRDGDGSVQAGIARAVDLSHPTRTDGGEDLVSAQTVTGQNAMAFASIRSGSV